MNLREQLFDAMQGKVVVMGIGNPCRGDDAAGSRIAQQISAAPDVRVIDAQEVPENYLSQIADEHPDTIVLIDCVDMKSAPGSVALFESNQTIPYWPSTHRVPMSLLVDYLKQATRARILLIAIQPQRAGFLAPMSAEVLSSVASIADILNDIFAARSVSAGSECTHPQREEVPA
jgi:hydrogenase maturation protease HycI